MDWIEFQSAIIINCMNYCLFNADLKVVVQHKQYEIAMKMLNVKWPFLFVPSTTHKAPFKVRYKLPSCKTKTINLIRAKRFVQIMVHFDPSCQQWNEIDKEIIIAIISFESHKFTSLVQWLYPVEIFVLKYTEKKPKNF